MRIPKETVSQIKSMLAERKTQTEIAAAFKVSRSVVSDIATGRIHKDVDWPNGQPVPKKPGGQRTAKEYDPTNERILELESDIVHLNDELKRERARVKANAKTAGLFKAMKVELQNYIQPIPELPPKFQLNPKARIIEHCVMHISDGHHDQVVEPSAVGGLEEHNFPISCVRAERYVDTVIDWTQQTLAPTFNFPVLWCLAYGDFTSGEIHAAAQRSYYRNQFRNCLAIGQLHALMYRDLAPYFPVINVVYLSGNHGRRTPKKDYNGALDNWDALVAEVTRLHCRDLSNVNFLIPDAWSLNLDINGVGFNVSHGDDVPGNSGVPWYGMQRRQKNLIALGSASGGKPIRYFCVGHHHTASTLSDINGELLVNGAWVATDAYSYNKFSGYREPAQWFHGVSPKYGITWRLDVKLKSDHEKQGPQRYKIDGGRDVGPLL